MTKPGYFGDWARTAKALGSGRNRFQCRSRVEVLFKHHLTVAKTFDLDGENVEEHPEFESIQEVFEDGQNRLIGTENNRTVCEQ